MKSYRSLFLYLVLLVISCKPGEEFNIPSAPNTIDLTKTFYYEVNLNDRSNDTFKVRLYVGDLTNDNAVFQFPATVPGTYDIMNIGRYVTSFKVYNKQFIEISSNQISTNQWQIDDPNEAYIIDYTIAETWDTPVNENSIYLMAGTSIENDHVLLNTFCVLGYPTGLKNKAFTLKIDHPAGWTVGTSLEKTNEGYYWAKDYDYLVDSPLLLGGISHESTIVDNTHINVYTYSVTDEVTSSQILPDIEKAINDASKFLKGLPVDRYSFIFHFENVGAGALEHSFSSVYVLEENPYESGALDWATYHEFFHIVTPLNIHSEIIENFNFVTPTASAHLWLYEGVTEWASDMMQFRNGSMDLNELFSQIARKIYVDQNFYDPLYSLSEIGINAYTEEGGMQYGNIYSRGALVAMLLDIRLLELSNGSYGLRELILELMETYGPEKAFSETEFFNVLVDMTYPEIEDFINDYIKGVEPLPFAAYFDLLGIEYNKTENTLFVNDNPSLEQQQMLSQWSVNF